MNVIEESHSRLVFEENPFTLIAICLVFIVAGFIPLIFLGRTELTCQRQPSGDGNCQIINVTLVRQDIKRIPLAAIQEAIVSSSTDSEGSTTYQVRLITHQGTFPFGAYTSNYGYHRDFAHRINQFLAGSGGTTLQEKQDYFWIAILVTILIPGTFLLILLFGVKKLIVEIDKSMGTLVVRKQGVVNQDVQEYRLRDMTSVIVQTSYSSDGDTYRVALVMNGGEYIPLRNYYSSSRRSKAMMAAKICEFLNLMPDI